MRTQQTNATEAAVMTGASPDNVLRLRDGRLLGYGEFGDPQGTPSSSSTASRGRGWKRGLVKRLQPRRT
jgi:hypothetical protein